jgi:hypothetical protein
MAGHASAATVQSWTLIDSNCTAGCPSSNTFRQYQSNNGQTLGVQALYVRNGSLDNTFRRTDADGTALISSQGTSGIGLTNPRTDNDVESASPNHAIDNINNRDFVLLDFGQLMDLTSFSVGWIGSDSDMSFLFAPTSWNMGTQPIFDPITGLQNNTTINDLINGTITGSVVNSNKWSQQNFEGVAANTTYSFASGTRARYALVSGALDENNDAFKFKVIKGTQVPVPGTLALLGLGMGALCWVRRHNAKS